MRLFCFTCFCLFVVYLSYAQNPPQITVTGNTLYCGDAVNIVSAVDITDADPGDTTLNDIRIQISEGYNNGDDSLALLGNHPAITSLFNANEGILTLQGPATFQEFEAAILDVVFLSSQDVLASDKSISINLANANYLPSTGHYYFYIPSVGISWTSARVLAETQSLFGIQGYLATVTTPEESQLVGEQVLGTGWIGATDVAQEGQWTWVTGPEAGTVFYNQDTGQNVNEEFSYWNNGEPNNFGGNEHYAHVTDPSVGLFGSWNDLPNQGDAPGTPYHPQGYVVEYGGMPGDPELNLSASTTISQVIPETQQVYYCLANFPDTITLESSVENPTSDYSFSWSTGATTPTIAVNAIDDYTVTVSFNGNCFQELTISVLPINPPEIQTILVSDFVANNSATVLLQSSGDYQYAIDGGPYQTANTFTNLSLGLHDISVIEAGNNCGEVSRSILVGGYPKVFTPNGDGYNDTWSIKHLTPKLESSVKVEVFNRYGKLLKTLLDNAAWDGNYNGEKLPTNDYWIIISLGDGRRFTDHISLKR